MTEACIWFGGGDIGRLDHLEDVLLDFYEAGRMPGCLEFGGSTAFVVVDAFI